MNRVDAEVTLIRRVGPIFAALDLDGTTAWGTNADLNDPIWYALQKLDYSVASITSVTNAEVSAVATDDNTAFLDIAELRALQTALNAATNLTDITIGPRRESLGQLADRLSKTIAEKQDRLNKEYGDMFGQGLEAGTFSISSVEDGDNIY